MALNFLNAMPNKDDKVHQIASQLEEKIKKGYDRLITFKTKEGGYEWFSKSLPHPGLSAYAVVEFEDMKQAIEGVVDQGMLNGVKQWLNSIRDGEGSFLLDDRALDTFGRAPQDTSDAYIVWALTSAGETDLEKEIEHLKEVADSSTDPYIIGLLAASLYNLGRDAEAKKYSDRLVTYQEKDGSVAGASTSITSSKGEYLLTETTSIAVIAWLNKQSEFGENIEKAVDFLQTQVDGGSYGSTQSTILALKALTTYL